MKKILSIILCLTLVLGLAVVASAAGESATISFASKDLRTNYSTDIQVWESNGIKVTNSKAGSKSDVGDYADPARFYKGSDLTIEYPNMTSIVLECPKDPAVWVNTNTDANATVTVDGSTVTITFAAPTNSFSLTGLSAQTRVSEMTVYAGKATAPETPEKPVAPTIVDIATAVAGADGAEFSVKGVVTLIEGQNIYLLDKTGGICVRASAKVEDLKLGDVVIGTGKKSVYNGTPQLGGSYEKASGTGVAAKATTIDALTAADFGAYVKLSGVTITEIFDNNGVYTNPNITVTDGTNTIQIYKAVCAKNDDGSWAYAVGDVIDVYAAVGVYNKNNTAAKTTIQLRNTEAGQIVAAGAEGPSFIGSAATPDEPNQGTGDYSIAGLVIALTAATGCAVVLTKKKEF